MAADIFMINDARQLLSGKTIFMFGDSNTRALYKDLTWLLEYGNLVHPGALKKKNESSHANDLKLSSGLSTNSCDYEEIREYKRCGVHLRYEFLTRVFQERLQHTIKRLAIKPDILVINSCLWDISRYGPNSIKEYQENIDKTISLLKFTFPSTKIIWTTTLPPSPKCRGGFLNDKIKFIQSILPFNVVQANNHVVEYLKQHDIDVLDYHYHFKFLIDMRSPDGIHWEPEAVRYMTNLLLTHISICWGRLLPGKTLLTGKYKRDYCFVRNNLSYNDNTYNRIRIHQNSRNIQRRNRPKYDIKRRLHHQMPNIRSRRDLDFTLDI